MCWTFQLLEFETWLKPAIVKMQRKMAPVEMRRKNDPGETFAIDRKDKAISNKQSAIGNKQLLFVVCHCQLPIPF